MKLYENGTKTIWTDSHIREQLLQMHLNPNTDAASRQPAIIEKTIDWMLKGESGPGKLVDLGCGPGLYSECFAQRGWRVLGIDINPSSIAYAKTSAQSRGIDVQYLEGSYLESFTRQLFDLGICVYCDFGALPVPQQEKFLMNVHDLLVPGGTFIFDVFGTGLSETMKEGKNRERIAGKNFWSENSCYVLTETVHFRKEMVWGRKYVIIPDQGEQQIYVLWDHYFTEEKIRGFVERFGFILEEVKTDLIAENNFTSNNVLFLKARKR